MSIDPWPAGHGRRVLAEIDSTNAEAARRAAGLANPEWILALSQTAARGRRGRRWANTDGNFAATLAMPIGGAPELVALRSFVAALALFDALVAVTGRTEPFTLKWPNDVLLNGGKLAGILLESTGQGARIDRVAIGFGVNLRNAPEAEDLEPVALRPVALLSETGADVAPEAFLDLLAPAFARHEAQLLSHGFAPVRQAWLDRAAGLGEVITARAGKRETVGTFETVDAAGNLVLSTRRGRVAIPAADIFF